MAESYYKIAKSTLREIGNSIRGKTGTTAEIPLTNFKPMIDSIETEPILEELTVTPTREEQTFFPASPAVGFSMVLVEAASIGVEYPSAMEVSF